MLRDAGLSIPLAIALALGTLNSATAESQFNRVANALEQRLNVQRERIPGSWLVNGFLSLARPAGVKHLEIAVFPDIRAADSERALTFHETVVEALGTGWHPWLRSRSSRDGEWTVIYVKQAGRDCEMVFATVEDGEASVIKMKVKLETMSRYLHNHRELESPRSSAFP